ncbi:hypothetical protein [Sphaerisporangium fuscum]|uniref:hypothetical protein n=1 Tax=Sphaerisporangium fuscum TaxID=2835868 RepID=UPI001BDCA044|nr:hypothetical protein [Sphaerisporangium fuscum]
MSVEPRVAVWGLVLLAAGVAAAVLCSLTAPPLPVGLPREFVDSPYLLPAFAALTVLAGVAGWWAPGGGALWGVLVAVPFWVLFFVNAARLHPFGGAQGLWPVGLIYLAFLTAFPVVTAFLTSIIAARRR